MAIYAEARGTADFLVSEANGMYRSREEVTVDASGGAISAATILGKLDSNGNYVPHVIAGSNGSEDVSGILFEGIADGVTEPRTVVVRDCEVVKEHLIYPTGATDPQKATIDAALTVLGIILR